MRNCHDLIQGENSWHVFRLEHFGASEASAVLGLSPYKTRTNLLNEKKTGLMPNVNNFTQAIFNDGHEVEKLARVVVEKMLGEDLSPVTYSFGKLSASCDGLNLLGGIAWETKQFNKAHFEQVKNGELPDIHWPQCQQVLYVTGAEKLFFTISDGTKENTAGVWVSPDADKQQTIVDAWNQFEIDLANYVPVKAIEMPKAQVVLGLPALFIHAKGEITTSNMQEYGEALAQRLQEVRAIALITDQDFSNAKDAAKLLRENIQQAKLAKDAMLAQTVTVGEAARMIDHWCEDMRLTALQLEKDVEREDTAKKQEMIADAKHAWLNITNALYAEIKPIELVVIPPDFAGSIKGKRTYASMQDAINTLMAQKTIEVNKIAADMRTKLVWFNNYTDYKFLFSDLQSIISKELDDFMLLVESRIATHKQVEVAKEAKIKVEAEQQAIAKIEAESKAKLTVQTEPLGIEKVTFASSSAIQQKRPTDEQLIEVLVLHYERHESTIIEWLQDMDLKSAYLSKAA